MLRAQKPHKGNQRKVVKSTPLLKVQKRELAVWIKMNTTQIEHNRAYCASAGCSRMAGLGVLEKVCDYPLLLAKVDSLASPLKAQQTQALEGQRLNLMLLFSPFNFSQLEYDCICL